MLLLSRLEPGAVKKGFNLEENCYKASLAQTKLYSR